MGACVSKSVLYTDQLVELAQQEEQEILDLTNARMNLFKAIAAWVEYECDPNLVGGLEKVMEQEEKVEAARVLFGDNYEEVIESVETIQNIWQEWFWASTTSKKARRREEKINKRLEKVQAQGGRVLETQGVLIQGKHRLLTEDASNRVKAEEEKLAQLTSVILKEFPEAYHASKKAYTQFFSDMEKWGAAVSGVVSGISPARPEISTAERGTSEKQLRKVLHSLGKVKQQYKHFLANRVKWVDVVQNWAKREDTSNSNVRYVVQLDNSLKVLGKAVANFDKQINAAAGLVDKIIDDELIMLKAFKKSSFDSKRFKAAVQREERFMRKHETVYIKHAVVAQAHVRTAEDLLLKSLENKRDQAEKLDTKKGEHVKSFLESVVNALKTVDSALKEVEVW